MTGARDTQIDAASAFTLPNGSVLPNRLAKAALSEQLGTVRGAPTPELVRLYERWGRGGFALLVTGNVMIDRRAIGEPRNVVVEDARDLGALQAWSAASKAGGAQVWAQVNHPGRQSPRVLSPVPVAPSAVQLRISGQFARPRALTSGEIDDLVQRFARTAGLLVDAGFDGVQIHAAHGYLISQFLSPLSNRRDDEWGGDAERRRRFLLEVVRAVRERIGPERGLGVKLNSADFQRGGFDEEESMAVVDALSGESLDLLEISGGTYERAAMVGAMRESTRQREAYFLDYARAVRDRASMPLMLTGGLRSREGIDAALAEGAVDLVGLGRPACLEPDLPSALLRDPLGAAAETQPLKVGLRAVDDLNEIAWHTTQMWRIGGGRDPDPAQRPQLGAARYLTRLVLDAGRRRLGRPPRHRR